MNKAENIAVRIAQHLVKNYEPELQVLGRVFFAIGEITYYEFRVIA
jgi:hypothetical protein